MTVHSLQTHYIQERERELVCTPTKEKRVCDKDLPNFNLPPLYKVNQVKLENNPLSFLFSPCLWILMYYTYIFAPRMCKHGFIFQRSLLELDIILHLSCLGKCKYHSLTFSLQDCVLAFNFGV